MQKMIWTACILLTFLSLSFLVACGLKPKESLPKGDAEPELATPMPDLKTEIPAVEPAVTPPALPSVTLVGKITMDSAKIAQITLKVSADGKLIEGLGFSFTELKCEGFSAGSMSTEMTTRESVTDGKFEFSSSFGVISGRFTSPTAVKGSIHLKFNQKPIGEFECGTWEWSAKGK